MQSWIFRIILICWFKYIYIFFIFFYYYPCWNILNIFVKHLFLIIQHLIEIDFF